MINKEQAEKLGINIIDSTTVLAVDKNESIEKLKKLAPSLVNSDGVVDTKALQDFVDISKTTSNNQGYELTFAGKGLARAKADEQTTKELKIESKQSKDFDNTDNVIIRGDNIDVLKILYKNYHNKIKMIYIDPPYNTKNENFVYNDNFKQSEEELTESKEFGLTEDNVDFINNIYGSRTHSGWLSFMYPRLKLARELLTDDGVIFISIDDNEQANLKIICDEIFGEDNFVANIIWNKKNVVQNDAKFMSTNHESLLTYRKSSALERFDLLPRTKEMNARYSNPDNDPRGEWTSVALQVKSGRDSNLYEITFDNSVKWKPVSGTYPRLNRSSLEKAYQEGRLWFGKKGINVPRLKKYLSEVKQGVVSNSIWLNSEVGSTQKAKEDLKNILGKNIFETPKPFDLIKRCMELSFNKSAIVLDFFAGSGTTADAVMQLNAEDKSKAIKEGKNPKDVGNRKFILAQLDETIDEKKSKTAYDFCIENNFKPVISSITIERVNRAGDKIMEDFKSKNSTKTDLFKDEGKTSKDSVATTQLDIGYKVFSLVEQPKIDTNAVEISLINKRNEVQNTLYNMLVATSKPLNSKIEEIEKDILYKSGEDIYVLGNITIEKLDCYKNYQINIDAYSPLNLGDFLNLDITNKENINIIF